MGAQAATGLEKADHTSPDARVRDRRISRSDISFGVGFALAATLTVVATAYAISEAGLTGPPNPIAAVLLWSSLGVALALALLVAHRIARAVRGQFSASPGARLHLRFVALFSAAAFVPAIALALFMGVVVSQGFERWFATQVGTVVESSADVGRYLVNQVRDANREEAALMASDLNQAGGALRSDPERYGQYLAAQAENRLMVAAYVIDKSGAVLARAESDRAPGFQAPAQEDYGLADRGEAADRIFERESMIRVLVRLNAYRDTYLYVARPVDPRLLQLVRGFDTSVDNLRRAQEASGKSQALYVLAYLNVALLVLLGAVWLGLANATQIAEPIGRLAHAARRVAAGDLQARVSIRPERDEIDALGAAFNQMTAQLEAQRGDIVAAQEDAENRSRFIEAVLGAVSAGVISLDRDGRVRAANRSAGDLLGEGGDSLIGRRLVDVAPEFSDLLNEMTPHGVAPPRRVDLVREHFSVNLSVRMSPDAQGGLVLTFDDMTKLIAAQRQEAWKDVARRIAHEIKNPLTPIQLSAERLKRKFSEQISTDAEIFARCTETILRQVADIGRMVDEFSAFARTPAPRMAFADLSETARSAVFAQRISFSDISFDIEGAAKPIGLVCDERLIGQALGNLMKNAAEGIQARRARDGEPKTGRVLLRLRDLDFGVQCEIIDNGVGFPTHDRERLIEPYVTTRAKGAGLGLAIVARVIEDHGGLIELDDPPDGADGAVVRFVLPKRGEEFTESQPAARQGAP